MNKYLYLVLAAVIVTAANVGISRYMIDSAANTIKSDLSGQQDKLPKFIVVDEAILHSQLKVQPDGRETSPAQLLADRENLFTALRLQNYMVVNNSNFLTYPVTSELSNVNMQEVRAFLKTNNTDISTESDHEQTVRFAQELIQKQLSFTKQ